MSARRSTLSSISEDPGTDVDSSDVSLYVSNHGVVFSEPSERTSSPTQRRNSSKYNVSSPRKSCSKPSGRKVRLWGHQKGVDLESDHTKVIVAEVLNRAYEERERFFAKAAEVARDASQYIDSPPLPPRKSALGRIEEVKYDSADPLISYCTTTKNIQKLATPGIREKRVLYEPPPSCHYLKKFLNGETQGLTRTQSDMRLAFGSRDSIASKAPFRSEFRSSTTKLPSISPRKVQSPSKKPCGSPLLSTPQSKRSHLKTRSLITMQQVVFDDALLS